MTIPVMFIDDEKSVREALGQTLELEDYQVSLFASAKPALDKLTTNFQGVIITDINMPGIDGIQCLKQAMAIDPELSIIMLTGHGDISIAVDAMRLGAYDFLEKPFSTEHLLDVVKRAGEKRQLVLENRELRRELEVQSGPGPRILGNSPSMKQLRRMLSHLSQSSAPLLIHGEAGNGKSLVARFSHDHSPRQNKPFITVNANTENPQQLANDLFGFDNGQQSVAGLFEQVHGGTLYIKQLDKLPASLRETVLAQLAQLSQPAQESASTTPDVRVIASLTDDKKHLSNTDPFYQALYFQYNFVSLELPPLRQRPEDIILLFHNFLRADCSRFGIEPSIVPASLEHQLVNYSWLGNVRELRTFTERFILMGDQTTLDKPTFSSQRKDINTNLADRVAQFECKLLRDALNRHHGRLKDVQQELGLARKTLYDKMKKYDIDKVDFKS
ncbi:sigma-54 dependent transcriptional regulator [Photobacterium makurazakiensis]|uniref:sigma-54-dependent transcriptional regulator n=1 Tax=Photobacterium makurazakiensis TaxID=2910234 RepID=UPI003D09CEE2